MRELGVSTQGSLAAAIAFVFGGYLISVHNMLNTLLSVSWYPLVILCGYRMLRYGRRRWAIAGGVSLCCMFLAGGVEILIFALTSLLLLCPYFYLLPKSGVEKDPSLQRRLGLLGLALIIFLGLSMVQLLPFLELYKLSDRAGWMTLEEATRWSLAPGDLFYFLMPDLYGSRITADEYWKFQNYLKTIYVGPVSIFLAGIYFFRQGRRCLPLVAAMSMVLILSLGRYTPLYPFLYKHLPLFSSLRYPAKFLFIFVFCLSVAAGLGLDLVRKRFSEKTRLNVRHQGLLVGTAIFLALLLLLGRFFPTQTMGIALDWFGSFLESSSMPMALHNFNRLLFLTILTLMIIFFGLRGKLVRFGGPLLLILLTLDLFLGNRGFAQRLDAVSFHAETPMVKTLKSDDQLYRYHVTADRRHLKLFWRNYRNFHLRRKEALGYDLMMEHHLFDIDGYNVPLQTHYEKFISLIRNKPLDPPVPALLNMLNVKYVLAEGSVELPGYEWIRDGLGILKLYKNRNFMPRAFLIKDYQVLGSDQEFARVLHDPNFNPRDKVYLEKVPARFLALKREPPVPSLQKEVRVATYENNRLVVEVSTPRAALLFMSEAYYPGWQAYVDGREEAILRANYIFRAIPVGPGSHTVEVVFQPRSFKVGLALSLLTIVLLLGGWVFFIITRRTRIT
jgi:hypothetical protein